MAKAMALTLIIPGNSNWNPTSDFESLIESNWLWAQIAHDLNVQVLRLKSEV